MSNLPFDPLLVSIAAPLALALLIALGLPKRTHSTQSQVKAPAAADRCVTSMAMPASPLAASALPALKPNQPTHSMPAPVTVMVMLCGGIAAVP